MAFVRLEDLSGSIEVVFFPKLYQSSALLWEEGRLVVVEGKSNVREGEWKMLADKVWDLQSILQKIPSEEPVKISVNLEGSTPQDFQELQTLLKTEPGNRAIEFVVTKGAQTKIVPTPITVDWNEGLRSRLEARFGRCIVE
jgi:DNA polymerase-3 subunit alpha